MHNLALNLLVNIEYKSGELSTFFFYLLYSLVALREYV